MLWGENVGMQLDRRKHSQLNTEVYVQAGSVWDRGIKQHTVSME